MGWLRFLAYLWRVVRRLGTVIARRVVAFARRHARRIQQAIERGIAWPVIVEWILRQLGLG